MSGPSTQPSSGLPRLLGLIVAAVGFGIIASPALFALPLAALLIASHRRTATEYRALALSGAFALWWLFTSGDLPDQAVRAAALFAALAFTLTTVRTSALFIHRALHAVAIAGATITILLPVLGSSWGELRWWVAHQNGLTARTFTGLLWSVAPGTGNGGAGSETLVLQQLEQGLTEVVYVVADYYPALLALQLIVGLALATAIYHRVAREPRGAPLGPFLRFRFSEHLGWAAVIPLIVVLIPKLAGAKLAAANLLAVAAALYALRGVAVAAYGLSAIGAGGVFLSILLVIIFLLLLPILLAGAILLGVLDSGLRIRERWGTKTAAR